jgi:hypothetical protein
MSQPDKRPSTPGEKIANGAVANSMGRVIDQLQAATQGTPTTFQETKKSVDLLTPIIKEEINLRRGRMR